MFKRPVSGIMLFLLLVSTLNLAFNIKPVKAGGTIYIRADGSVDPPTAPIQRDGDIYTFTDNIYDSIVVERSNIIIDGSGYTLQGSGWISGDGFFLFGINNVIIKNINIKNFAQGIRLFSSSGNSISGNNITANDYYGVWLFSSSGNTISGNKFINNGLFVRDSYQNSVEDNTVNGRPLVYLEDASDYTVDDAGQVILVRSENIRVESLSLSRTDVGVELWETNNSIISGNNITANNQYGVWLFSSSGNSISGNNITANNGYGIWLDSSNSNTFSGNNITNNAAGIGLEDSSGNSISGNNITANGGEGIQVYSSSNSNSISGNNIANNGYGVWVYSSSGNSISGNNITANGGEGIDLFSSSGNSIYHNNFANTWQVHSDGEINAWDDGYPSGGNYWSDYTGADGNGDGIGDTPYIIDANNRDRCPLMEPWNPTSPPVGNCFVPYKIKVKFGVNDVREMVLDEYLKGVVSAEMYHGLGWPIEALKAQAVAARTFAVRTTQHNHIIEDVCTIVNTNGPHCQAWEPGPYNQNIEDAVSQTHNQVITYYGWILKNAMFFAWCNGHTVDSEDRFPDSKPYLRGVSCNGEKCMQYRSMYNPETCPYLASGNDISACNCRLLDKDNPEGGGYFGHRVGMCQEGAKTMANNGYSYVDIIKHYYTDVDVVTAATAERRITVNAQSPVELSVSDSQNRLTGLVNGSARSEIPNSEYDEETELLTIFLPDDQYRYIAAGVGSGLYGLILANSTEQGTAVFESNDIPMETNATHQYTIDWDALSQGGEGVNVQVDSEGDGVFDYDFTSDSELNRFEYVAATTKHDIEIVGIATSKSVTEQGYSLLFNATIMNYGVYVETFNITYCVNTTLIASQTVIIASGNFATLTFTWNTTGFAKGSYAITAAAEPVQGETYTADNTLIGGWVFVSIPGDINGDKYVNAKDAIALGVAFYPFGDYNPNADINGDGYCNAKDAVILGVHFGEHWE